MHVLHVPASVIESVAAAVLLRWKDGIRISSYLEVAERATESDSYLYVELSTSLRILIRSEAVPSQFMRKAVASALHLTQWDWRTMRNWTAFRETVQQFVA